MKSATILPFLQGGNLRIIWNPLTLLSLHHQAITTSSLFYAFLKLILSTPHIAEPDTAPIVRAIIFSNF